MIKVIKKQSNEIVDLSIISTDGVDWINDFLGNASAFGPTGDIHPLYYCDDSHAELYIADDEAVEWWQSYILDYCNADEAKRELIAIIPTLVDDGVLTELDAVRVITEIKELGTDAEFNDIPNSIMTGLDDIRDSIRLDDELDAILKTS